MHAKIKAKLHHHQFQHLQTLATTSYKTYIVTSPRKPSQELALGDEMATPTPIHTIFILALLSLSSSILASSDQPNITLEKDFIHCFTLHTAAADTVAKIISTPNTTSYTTTYLSSIQNLQYLSPYYTKPSLVVTPTDPSHVRATVSCGRATGLRLRVRSGGHDYEGLSYISYGTPFLILDLSNLNSITVNTTTNTAWIGAGATLGEVYYHISQASPTAAFPAGLCPTVGAGGHFTGGGYGTLARKYGLAADNIVDALIVDAGGNLLDRDADDGLFWAIRGGGGASFGVVVSYKVNLVGVPPIVTLFTVNRTLSEGATKLVTKWQHVTPTIDRNLFMRATIQAVDEDGGNRTIRASFLCLYLGRAEELLALMEGSFPELGVTAEDCKEMRWIESVLSLAGYANKSSSVLLDRRPQFNSSFAGKSDFVTEPIGEEGWEEIWKVLIEAKDEPVQMILDPWGGRMDEIPASATPFPYRKGYLYNIQYFMRWFDVEKKGETERHLEWMRKLYGFMKPYVSKDPRAAYLNYRDLDLGRNKDVGETSYSEARVWGERYFDGNFERLARVKGRVDAEDYFWNEQSVPPLLARVDEP